MATRPPGSDPRIPLIMQLNQVSSINKIERISGAANTLFNPPGGSQSNYIFNHLESEPIPFNAIEIHEFLPQLLDILTRMNPQLAPEQTQQQQLPAPPRPSATAEPVAEEAPTPSNTSPSQATVKPSPPSTPQGFGSTTGMSNSAAGDSLQMGKGENLSSPRVNTPIQAGQTQQTTAANQKLPSSNTPTNPGAVFSQQQKEQITKEVAVASYLLKGGETKEAAREGNQKPIETMQTLNTLEKLQQKLGTLQQEAKQELSKHPSEQTNKNLQNTLNQCKKELQDLSAQLKQTGVEKKDELPPHTPLEKQISTLRQKTEQVLTQARAALQEAAKSLTEKLRPPPSQQNQPSAPKEEQSAATRSQKQSEDSLKNPITQTPGQAKQGESAKDAKTMNQTTPGQTTIKGELLQRAEVKPMTPSSMLSTFGNKPEDKGEKTPLLKNAADLQELVKKSDKKELRLPATVGVVYPMKGKKRPQGVMPIAEKKTSSSNQTSDKDMPEKQEKKGGKTNQETDRDGEETQYVQPMIFVPERNTILGDPFNEKIKGEAPGIIVHIPPFLIATTPIVNLQFAQFLNDAWEDQTIKLVEPGIVTDLHGNILFKTHMADISSQIHVVAHEDNVSFAVLDDKEYYPVVQVSWFGAKAYCATYQLKLPNEQERETAAGMDLPGEHKSLKKFRFGFKNDEITPLFANYRDESDTKILPVAFYDGQNEITRDDVKYKTENAYSPYGCYDMSGNVYEWISEGSKTKKIVKGGSYLSPPEQLRVAARKTLDPQTCAPDVSFRVALDIPPAF